MKKKSLEIQNTEASEDPLGPIDYRWHLARTPAEVSLTEMEFALMRSYEGFARWQAEALAVVLDQPMQGSENALLHIIRMNDRPKSVRDLARLTNREDVPNIQYSLRKLVGAGLVVREGSGRSGVTYRVTESGRQVTEDFAALRRRLLVAAVANVPGFSGKLDDAVRALNLLSGIYAEMSRIAVTHRPA